MSVAEVENQYVRIEELESELARERQRVDYLERALFDLHYRLREEGHNELVEEIVHYV